ncbi:hypothetical protein E2C01_014687 [Portunus trituberculatus]|uniref:Uncharacterized protein n=1 Tax=Portunus trituberculatus TaxID=210409 RepID=A0A5B7DL01_PORTR|nr:hypothetical protein [Portunus trituberculatus]
MDQVLLAADLDSAQSQRNNEREQFQRRAAAACVFRLDNNLVGRAATLPPRPPPTPRRLPSTSIPFTTKK